MPRLIFLVYTIIAVAFVRSLSSFWFKLNFVGRHWTDQLIKKDESKILYLPSQIFVVCVSNVQGLCGEGVGLHLHICSGDLVDETGFTHIRETLTIEGSYFEVLKII